MSKVSQVSQPLTSEKEQDLVSPESGKLPHDFSLNG
jgi:hypothetical protein